jgi:hypothetical protein
MNPVIARVLLGLIIGTITAVGFYNDGIGGAILGLLLGFVVAALVLAVINFVLTEIFTREMAEWLKLVMLFVGTPALVIAAIWFFWGVGKP